MGNSKSRHSKRKREAEKEEQDIVNESSHPDISIWNEERKENLRDLQLAYKDQGYHEMEFTFGRESELEKSKIGCQKNACHFDFIPVTKFTVEHLPECWRDSLVFDLITTMISLTVRLAVGYTSKDRPPDYPLYNRRGQDGLIALGSGIMKRVSRKFAEKDGGLCPCRTCQKSPDNAKKQWGEFVLTTAKCVVFDTSEAKHTECKVFFDSDEDMSKCPWLEGVEVVKSASEDDFCDVKCVTHDKGVFNKLEEIIGQYWNLHDKLREKYTGSRNLEKTETVVVISHPHGLCKYVTVGEVTDRTDLTFQYNAETCMGSSGGPVLVLKEWDRKLRVNGPLDAAHSRSQQRGQNESTTWWI